jgi:hypothetical protein
LYLTGNPCTEYYFLIFKFWKIPGNRHCNCSSVSYVGWKRNIT